MGSIFAIVSSLVVSAMLVAFFLRFAANGRDRALGILGIGSALAISGLLGASGALSDFGVFPPPFMLFILFTLTLVTIAAFSKSTTRLLENTPLRLLIAMQGFRVLPELLLDLSWRDGLAPIQMTYHGRNLDILSALGGIVVAAVWPALKNKRAWAIGYNVIALGLLINIVAVAILSTPVPFRYFMNEPANTFVTTFPYIWLPTIHVSAALFLHVITFRKVAKGRAIT